MVTIVGVMGALEQNLSENSILAIKDNGHEARVVANLDEIIKMCQEAKAKLA